MRPRTKSVAALLAFVLIAACASTGPQSGPLAPEQPQTTVRVENRNFADMTVYVLRFSQRRRLGTVTGGTTATFTIPRDMVFGATPLRFQMTALASRAQPMSHEIVVSPGDQVVLVIP